MLVLVITILSREQLSFLNTSIRERDNAILQVDRVTADFFI